VLGERTGAPVIVTLGAEGALLHARGRSTRLRAPEVEAIDATGAGDALNGVLAASLAAGLDLAAAARRAVAAASRSVTVAGARAGMPRSEDLEPLPPEPPEPR
jgi:ribokinase